LKGLWPWPWIRPYGIPSCITHRPLPTYQISLKSKKLFVDVRTYVRTDVRTFSPSNIIRSTFRSRPKKEVEGRSPSLPFPPSSFLPYPAAKRLPENQLGSLGERCKLPSGVRGEAPATNVFWAWKSHLTATILVIYLSLKWRILKHFINALRKKNSCIGKKCQNSVRAFKK